MWLSASGMDWGSVHHLPHSHPVRFGISACLSMNLSWISSYTNWLSDSYNTNQEMIVKAQNKVNLQ